jgi:hypothetical protein
VVLVGAGCGSGGGRTASPASTTAVPSTSAPTTTAATATTTAPPAVPTFDEMLAKARAALLQTGQVTHLRMDAATEATDGSQTQEVTVDAWADPTQPLVRVEHQSGTDSDAGVTIVDSGSGINPEDPVGVLLLSALVTGVAGSAPGGIDVRADILDGRPVIVSEFLFPPADESYQAQRVSLIFDADGRLVNEVRRPEGGDPGWTTKTISYTVDFVDPATLPDDFWNGPGTGGPAGTEVPATDVPVPQDSYGYMTAGEAAPKIAELVQQGLPVTWLGPTYEGTQFGSVMVNSWPSPTGIVPEVGVYYVSAGDEFVNLTETTAGGWPVVREAYSEIASIETNGEPVEGLGGRAFLARGTGWDTPGYGALVLFRDNAVVMIQFGTNAATAAETDAKLIAVVRALQPFPTP